nr:DUF2179 domain-containing protein [Planococcus glaciei]
MSPQRWCPRKTQITYRNNCVKKGYGVTDWETNGHEGPRRSLQILTPKKRELKLYQTIKELEPQAFVVANDSKTIHGGFWIRTVRGRTMSHR